MEKHGAAASSNSWSGVVIDLNDEVIEMIVARQVIAVRAFIKANWLIVMPIRWIFGPGILWRDPPNRQGSSGLGVPVGPPPQSDWMKDTSRGAAVTFAFVGPNTARPQSDRNALLTGDQPALPGPASRPAYQDRRKRPITQVCPISSWIYGASHKDRELSLRFCPQMLYFAIVLPQHWFDKSFPTLFFQLNSRIGRNGQRPQDPDRG